MVDVGALDREMRLISICGVCGRPWAGVVPAGASAEEAGLCTGRHSLWEEGPSRAFGQREEKAKAALAGLVAAGREKEARRLERRLRLARNAYVIAVVHAASQERIERESRRAWGWLLEAEREVERVAAQG